MKLLALVIILLLHLTGTWSRLPTAGRTNLTAAGAGMAPAISANPATPTPAPALPVRVSGTPLTLDTAAAIAIDRTTATVLYAQSAEQQRPIASVTKLVTTLVIASRHNLDETVTVPKLPHYEIADETMGLVPGDTIRIKDLLQAALVPSENDAADTLAITDAGSVAAFADRMNATMSHWGIGGTHFVSASGLQDTNNYATATALSKIAGLFLDNPDLAGIASLPSINITTGAGRNYHLKSTNELLASGQFYGIKTGYTLAAGECFVGLARINGHDIITVVLGASDRFGTTTKLTKWIRENWQWL